jgi:hypothetical protein
VIPIFQTRFGPRRNKSELGGNCFQAALASILELPLDDVPDFCNIYPIDTDEWYFRYIEWLQTKGLSVVTIGTDQGELEKVDCYKGCLLLVFGKNDQGVEHCVIYKNGIPVHNPNPHCSGITPSKIDILFPINPALSRRADNEPLQ